MVDTDEPAWRTELRDALRRLRQPRTHAAPARGAPGGDRRRPPVVVVLDAGASGLSAGALARELDGRCEVVHIGAGAALPEQAAAPLRWIPVLHGRDVRLVAVEDVCYCRSDSKYTALVTAEGESLIRMPLRELAARLDPARFWRIHRGTLVNAAAIASVSREAGGQLEVRLKSRGEVLKVSEAYQHRFKHL